MYISTRNHLAYYGLIPFALAGLSLLLAPESFHSVITIAFATYSAIIASFLSGSLWGQALHVPMGYRSRFFIISNLLALCSWLGLLLCYFGYVVHGLSLLSSLYILIFWVEKTHIWNSIDIYLVDRLHHYWRLRWHLTVAVISFHIFMILFILPKGFFLNG